ncbi:pentatricopeptide repeat-containing protein mitochondrial-like [Dorcoceras hygrometricum]|uniref:Pentatricopeptide repeat-containing protein mitochondrial-like n=1 Tax=Dorcoceras hygrometricum TaxID=472368 RepID=A0A2Z7D0B2_9LAMI|nr:pentatricopeptide repeat-containing protein mitochondrial-like [Dorcoceras hygrometricum]
MALRCNLRSSTLRRFRLFSTSILNPDSKSILTSKEKSRSALSLIRFEKNPERVLDICRAAALTPESHLDRVAYSRAISSLKESQHYEGIRTLINESITRPYFKSERFVSHFVVLYGQAGLVRDAVRLFDEMSQMGVDRSVKTLNSLLFSCILAGEYGEMKRVFSEYPKKYGLEPTLETYNTVLKGFCESGSANSSYSILAEMERKGIKPNATTFSTAITGFYKEEKFGDVGKMMDMMKKHGVGAGIGLYNVRIQSLCKLKRSTEAKLLLDTIKGRGMKPNRVTYNHLIFGFCVEGKMEIAKNLLKEMIDSGLKPEARCYFTLIYYLCQRQDFEAALAICKDSMLEDWVPNMSTMKSLVDGLVSIEKIDDARWIIEQVKEKFSRNAGAWAEIEENLPK